MGLFKEFKEFAIKGNVIDLAVGVVIGAAFSGIVTSFVDDVITPAILTPALEASNLSDLSELVIPGTAIKYGSFLSAILSFLIVAFALFVVVRGVNRMKKTKEVEAPAPAGPTDTERLLMEIRDELRKK